MLACAVLAAGALGVGWWLRQPAGLAKLTGTTAAVIALGVGLYCAMIVPVQVAQTSEDRAEATELSRLLPPDAALYAVRTGYERMLFYLGLRVQYPASLEALPRQENVFALLREPEDLQRVATLPGASRLHSFAGGEDQKPRELWRFDNRR
jgi:hypothetical protein